MKPWIRIRNKAYADPKHWLEVLFPKNEALFIHIASDQMPMQIYNRDGPTPLVSYLKFYSIFYFRLQRTRTPRPAPSSLQLYKYKCSFSTCAVVLNTVAQLKLHLLHSHKEMNKICIYSNCGYSAYNPFTLKVNTYLIWIHEVQ